MNEYDKLHCFKIQQKEWETETFNKGNIKFFSFGWLRNLYFFTVRVVKHWTLQTRVARILRSVVADLKYSVSKSVHTVWNPGIIELEHLYKGENLTSIWASIFKPVKIWKNHHLEDTACEYCTIVLLPYNHKWS